MFTARRRARTRCALKKPLPHVICWSRSPAPIFNSTHIFVRRRRFITPPQHVARRPPHKSVVPYTLNSIHTHTQAHASNMGTCARSHCRDVRSKSIRTPSLSLYTRAHTQHMQAYSAVHIIVYAASDVFAQEVIVFIFLKLIDLYFIMLYYINH